MDGLTGGGATGNTSISRFSGRQDYGSSPNKNAFFVLISLNILSTYDACNVRSLVGSLFPSSFDCTFSVILIVSFYSLYFGYT